MPFSQQRRQKRTLCFPINPIPQQPAGTWPAVRTRSSSSSVAANNAWWRSECFCGLFLVNTCPRALFTPRVPHPIVTRSDRDRAVTPLRQLQRHRGGFAKASRDGGMLVTARVSRNADRPRYAVAVSANGLRPQTPHGRRERRCSTHVWSVVSSAGSRVNDKGGGVD